VIVASLDGRILFWSPGAERIIGYSCPEALGASMDLIVPECHRAAHWQGFRRAMDTPGLRRMAADIPVRCADGEVRYLAGSLTVLIDGLGRAAGAVAIFCDDASTGVRPFS
jgi:PAS domain S-box-containing protein